MIQYVSRGPGRELMVVNTQKFDETFAAFGPASREVQAATCVLAHEISMQIGGSLDQRDEIGQELCVFLLERLGDVDPTRGSPRGYLWFIGNSRARELLGKGRRETPASVLDDPGDCPRPGGCDCDQNALSVLERCEPVRRDENMIRPPDRSRPMTAVDFIDRSIKRTRTLCGDLLVGTFDYFLAVNSIETLQGLRYALAGEYRPLNLPTIIFTAESKRTVVPI